MFNLLIALMKDAVTTSETSVNFYQIARRNIAEDVATQSQVRRKNILKTTGFWM
jgi:hypothetical protein